MRHLQAFKAKVGCHDKWLLPGVKRAGLPLSSPALHASISMPKGLLPSAGALPPYHSYALMLSLCELPVHKPLVPLQLSLIGINLTISFWGLFPLPVLDLPDFPWLLPAWKVILGLSFYFLLNLPSAPSICTAVGLLILQVEKFFLWISNGDICKCLTDYSKMDHTLLWLNRMRCWWGGARMQSKRMWDGRTYNKINKLTLINTSKRKKIWEE